jgi:hypothetical protein
MNRCFTFSTTRSLALAMAALGLGAAAWAQTAALSARFIPANTDQAVMEITTPPNLLLNGKDDRLSPGARIRGTNNMLVMSGMLVSQQLPVRYQREPNGLIHEVWILTPEEAALNYRRPANLVGPVNPNLAPSSATPRTPRDDGKTPFNQLPKYPNQ